MYHFSKHLFLIENSTPMVLTMNLIITDNYKSFSSVNFMHCFLDNSIFPTSFPLEPQFQHFHDTVLTANIMTIHP